MEYPIPDYGDLFTVQEFVAAVNSGCFIDYDGTGYYATETMYQRDRNARPSDIAKGLIANGEYTHVLWFNK